MSNQGDAGANGAEAIQQAEAGDNHNVNNGNVNIQEQGEGVMVNMFQAMNIRVQVEAARREAARQVNGVAANAGAHRRQDGSFTMSNAERGQLG
jgi:hypothetical protein